MSSASVSKCFVVPANFYRIKSYVPFRRHWRYSKNKNETSGNIDYVIVLDFEATCRDKQKILQEIIEFPCLKLNVKTMCVEDTFHEYVRPVINPQLSSFCTELTGIIQEMVDTSDTFPNVLQRFNDWREHKGLTVTNSVYITSGDWDLGKMFPLQCDLCGLPIPQHMHNWIDLKKFYGRATGFMPNSLREAIQKCGLKFHGRQHSGIDDCLNIANVVRKLSHNNYTPTSQLVKVSNGYRVVAYPSS